jgi:hypothetical protein
MSKAWKKLLNFSYSSNFTSKLIIRVVNQHNIHNLLDAPLNQGIKGLLSAKKVALNNLYYTKPTKKIDWCWSLFDERFPH